MGNLADVKDESAQTWYLILRLGTPLNQRGVTESSHFAKVNAACRPLGIHCRCLYVDDVSGVGRYLFRFRRYQPDDAAAQRIGECFHFCMAFTHGPVADADEDRTVLPIPHSLLKGKRRVNLHSLADLDEARPFDERWLEFPRQSIGSVVSTVAREHERAWEIVPLAYRYERVFRALRFLKSSQDNFYVYPGSLRDVLADPDAHARSACHQSGFEHALQDAFKAVEAIIGDPPRDDRKFFRKLRENGLDPNKKIGWGPNTELHEAIRNMNMARDRRAAHGSTSDRQITVLELLEHQSCAHYVVDVAVSRLLGWRAP